METTWEAEADRKWKAALWQGAGGRSVRPLVLHLFGFNLHNLWVKLPEPDTRSRIPAVVLVSGFRATHYHHREVTRSGELPLSGLYQCQEWEARHQELCRLRHLIPSQRGTAWCIPVKSRSFAVYLPRIKFCCTR